MLFNTRYMDAAVTQLREDGFDIRDEDVARLSPFVRHRINVFGRYSFQLPDLPGGLRPLRDKDAIDEERHALARTAGQDAPGGMARRNVRRCSQCAARLPEGSRRSRRYCTAPAESDDVAKAAVARVLADRSHSAQYGSQQVGPQRRQIGQIEGVTDVTTVPPGREQSRAAQDSEVAGNLRR